RLHISEKKNFKISDIIEDDKELISLCSVTYSGTLTICSHHKKLFLDKYEFLQNCCDPFSVPTKSIKSSLSTLYIPKAEMINSLTTGTNIKPGQKICKGGPLFCGGGVFYL
ncbi:hypothetical protein LSH36_21g08036, partial [Paralvinella palmiformis]